MRCLNENCKAKFKQKFFSQQYCSKECYQPNLKLKPINKVSKKQSVRNLQYRVQRIEFLSKKENCICPVTGQKATQVHHMKGRKGYADEWARDNKIWLLNDVRFFLGVSADGHKEIEENPEWAKEMGYSLNRI